MPSPAASVEARAVMMETWAQPPDDGTARAGVASAADMAMKPAVPATTAATRVSPRRDVERNMSSPVLVAAQRGRTCKLRNLVVLAGTGQPHRHNCQHQYKCACACPGW